MEGANDARVQALEIEKDHVTIQTRPGIQHIATRAVHDGCCINHRRDIARPMQPWQIQEIKGRHRTAQPVHFQAGKATSSDRKFQEAGLGKDVEHQIAVFKVITCEAGLIVLVHPLYFKRP